MGLAGQRDYRRRRPGRTGGSACRRRPGPPPVLPASSTTAHVGRVPGRRCPAYRRRTPGTIGRAACGRRVRASEPFSRDVAVDVLLRRSCANAAVACRRARTSKLRLARRSRQRGARSGPRQHFSSADARAGSARHDLASPVAACTNRSMARRSSTCQYALMSRAVVPRQRTVFVRAIRRWPAWSTSAERRASTAYCIDGAVGAEASRSSRWRPHLSRPRMRRRGHERAGSPAGDADAARGAGGVRSTTPQPAIAQGYGSSAGTRSNPR